MSAVTAEERGEVRKCIADLESHIERRRDEIARLEEKRDGLRARLQVERQELPVADAGAVSAPDAFPRAPVHSTRTAPRKRSGTYAATAIA